MKPRGGLDLAEYYRRNLRRFRAIRVPKEAVFHAWHFLKWQVVRPVARAVIPRRLLNSLNTYRALGGGSITGYFTTPALPLVPFARAASSGGRAVFSGGRVECPTPAVFPAILQNCVPPLVASYEFPPVGILTLHDAEIMGRSNLAFTAEGVVHHDLFRFSQDFTSEELHGKLAINPGRNTAKRYARPKVISRLEHAAFFTDAVASNYAHWLTEVLPRIHAYALAQDDFSVPLVLDHGLHRNQLRSAQLVSRPGRVVHELPASAAYSVGRLDVVTPAGYIPFEPRGRVGVDRVHGIFSPAALASMKSTLLEAIGPPASPTPGKIFLRRKSTGRALVNEQEIEDRLTPLGFVAVQPELLTFDEQFHLFAGAEVIVGATGAAFANLIFCTPGTRIIICVSAHPEHSFGYWQNMACATGNTVCYVLGSLKGPRAQGIHADFSVEASDVIQAATRPR